MGMSTNESFLLHKKMVAKKSSTNESLSTNGSVTNGSFDCILTTKNGLKTYFRWVFGHVWTEFFMPVNLPSTLIMNSIFLGQKSSIDVSPHFSPFYPDRVTSESYNNPLKVIPEGSMVEYLPVGSKEGPKTIIGKKKFSNHNPSPLCIVSLFVFLAQKALIA